MDQLALASERIERAVLADLHAAAPATTRKILGLRLETIGTALVSIARNDPTILLNRTIGLGVEGRASWETVEAIVAHYADEGIKEYFIHLHPKAEPPQLRDWLTQAGLVRGRGWMKFHREPTPPPALSSELRVQRIGTEQAVDFGRIAASAFDLSETAVPMIASLADRPGWRLYMSFADDIPAGTGALFIQDGVAWFDWGATLPPYRQRGGQAVVLCQRIRDAIALGCRLLVTTTGEAVEGDPQHSYKNILRTGFRPGYLRENFVPASSTANALGR